MLKRGISRSWAGSWPRFWGSWEGLGVVSGRLGPHLGRLGPHFGPKVPTHRRSHNRTKKKLKNRVQKEGVGVRGLDSGALVKQPIPGKASLNTRENANPAKWRKPGPLGKGNY